jgi:hypothetical protein
MEAAPGRKKNDNISIFTSMHQTETCSDFIAIFWKFTTSANTSGL